MDISHPSLDVSLAGPPSLLPDLTFPPETFLQRHNNLPCPLPLPGVLIRVQSPFSVGRAHLPLHAEPAVYEGGNYPIKMGKGKGSQITKPPRAWRETEEPPMERKSPNESKSLACKIMSVMNVIHRIMFFSRWPSVSISVVEHLDCQCLPVSAPSTDMAEAAAGRGRNPRFASGPDPAAAGVSPALSPSSSRASTTTRKQTPAPADVVFANDSREGRTRKYYETCQACKKQWDYCEVSESVVHQSLIICGPTSQAASDRYRSSARAKILSNFVRCWLINQFVHLGEHARARSPDASRWPLLSLSLPPLNQVMCGQEVIRQKGGAPRSQ